jgi:hypothetical protein
MRYPLIITFNLTGKQYQQVKREICSYALPHSVGPSKRQLEMRSDLSVLLFAV